MTLPGIKSTVVTNRPAKSSAVEGDSIIEKRLFAAGLSTLMAVTLPLGIGPAVADSVMHQVKYTVSATKPTSATIYYRDQDPTVFSDYSHSPYQFTPSVRADITSGEPLIRQVMLASPDQWAMVTVSSSGGLGSSELRCDLAVDGVVVASGNGTNGALCSLRNW